MTPLILVVEFKQKRKRKRRRRLYILVWSSLYVWLCSFVNEKKFGKWTN
uniref:Uncharacterized protein n=1 Tax=Meloidogyne enterolobii TaxID=390850 RepID=A0A6V7VIQ7_MELEN|nr:unnamed protein product [Meloidogyne enterolobii]